MATTTTNTDITITVIKQSIMVHGLSPMVLNKLGPVLNLVVKTELGHLLLIKPFNYLKTVISPLRNKLNLIKRENKLTSKNAKKNMNANNNLYTQLLMLNAKSPNLTNPIRYPLVIRFNHHTNIAVASQMNMFIYLNPKLN